jgi:hypothetical protein
VIEPDAFTAWAAVRQSMIYTTCQRGTPQDPIGLLTVPARCTVGTVSSRTRIAAGERGSRIRSQRGARPSDDIAMMQFMTRRDALAHGTLDQERPCVTHIRASALLLPIEHYL